MERILPWDWLGLKNLNCNMFLDFERHIILFENQMIPLAGNLSWKETIKLTGNSLKVNHFLWLDTISVKRKSFAGNYSIARKSFPLQEIIHLPGNYFLWQEFISFVRKVFRLKGNYFIWQEMMSFDRKKGLLTWNHFLWK